ncbi:MAG: ABC transporter permease [Clostridiales bacterium]|nr:ABC transporter permease [Clostridiales bacterium]
MKKSLKKFFFRWETALALLLLLEIVVFGAINPRFLKPRVLLGSVNDFVSICIISLFVTFVLITGGMDIQAGSIVGLTSISIGVLWNDAGINIWVACILGLLIGAFSGALSGFLIAYTDVQPMVVTLGGSFLYSGLALTVSKQSAVESYKGISGFPSAFTALTKGRVFGIIPYQLILFIFLTIVAYVLLHRPRYGRKVFLCGVNRNAAEYSGIHTKRIIMSTYILSGISAALVGIILTSYLGTAKTDLGKELTMPIITAVVLGGTSNLGGKGTIVGTALAAVVIGILRFGLSMAGINTQYLDIPVGVLLVLSVAIRSMMSNDKIASFVRKTFRRKRVNPAA